jgi:hypothetical protein
MNSTLGRLSSAAETIAVEVTTARPIQQPVTSFPMDMIMGRITDKTSNARQIVADR